MPATLTSPFNGLLGWDPLRVFDSVRPWGIGFNRSEIGYDIELPVPGFAPDQVELSYHEGVIQVRGKNDRRETNQSFVLPEDANPDKIEAHVENGMLTLHVERYEETKPRRIAIKST